MYGEFCNTKSKMLGDILNCFYYNKMEFLNPEIEKKYFNLVK